MQENKPLVVKPLNVAGVRLTSHRPSCRCECGDSVLIGLGSKITGPVSFGDNILLAQNVVMSGLNHDFEDPTKAIVNQGFSVKQIVVEDGVWIGASAVVTAGVRIGKNSVVGAGSVVTKDIPPFCVAVGNPAKVVKKYDFDLKNWVKVA